ncbi:MarR family winged helix-turn-helix transcriptional regulator [Marinigracilibium pacificum]|uniref:MarR family transcriptional regulator n=1 Tax=Marinigracilibium pacificum TaxID=2729599 RepID=A0A848IYC6_9BACT|nr:MarR family transcriptional regulator [Marinigracilibium pacificum]NMM46989.1 MarR family transcriptional regulator [Marinigracilibium pacificum]
MDYTDILIDLRRIIRAINLESKRIQKVYDLSIPQLLTLKFLKQSQSSMATQKDIKEHLNLNASTVTGIIKRLEAKGYIARLPRQDDKRSSLIALTKLGQNTFDKVPPLMQEKLEKSLEQMDESELNIIKSSINTLVNLMDAGKIDASPLLTPGDIIQNSNE